MKDRNLHQVNGFGAGLASTKVFQEDMLPASAPPQKLKRSLTLLFAVLHELGVMIGVGIYVLVGIATDRSGMHAPLAFVLAALVMSFSASEAAYVEKAFNRPRFSLTKGLLVVLTASVSAATISVASTCYLGVFVDLPHPH